MKKLFIALLAITAVSAQADLKSTPSLKNTGLQKVADTVEKTDMLGMTALSTIRGTYADIADLSNQALPKFLAAEKVFTTDKITFAKVSAVKSEKQKSTITKALKHVTEYAKVNSHMKEWGTGIKSLKSQLAEITKNNKIAFYRSELSLKEEDFCSMDGTAMIFVDTTHKEFVMVIASQEHD